MAGRLDKVLDTDICEESNWTPTLANPLGYAAQHRDQARKILACDPLRSLSWFNLARATLWAGDEVEALRIAREGSDIAPGAWLYWILVRTLIENGMYEEARDTIDLRFKDAGWALAARGLAAAKQGDRAAVDEAIREIGPESRPGFFSLSLYAWSGDRENANRLAAMLDQHAFGPWALWQQSHWCACDAPFDLEATPNFARMINDNDVPWPPKADRDYPLKDW
jgi:tetratricopeptide (TPR) repeat protein